MHTTAPRPLLKSLDWLFIGKNRGTHAVVCEVHNDRSLVVYENDNCRAMAEWVVWRSGNWAFEQTSPCSSYADSDSRLKEHVLQLRAGKPKIS